MFPPMAAGFVVSIPVNTRETPTVSWCAESADVTVHIFTWRHSQCHHSYDTNCHCVSLCQTCCRRQSVWIGWLPSRHCRNIFTERFVCSDTLWLVSGGVVFSKASKVCQTVLGTSLRQNLLFTNGSEHFTSAKRYLKTVTVASTLWSLLPNKPWPRWNVWLKKTRHHELMGLSDLLTNQKHELCKFISIPVLSWRAYLSDVFYLSD